MIIYLLIPILQVLFCLIVLYVLLLPSFSKYQTPQYAQECRRNTSVMLLLQHRNYFKAPLHLAVCLIYFIPLLIFFFFFKESTTFSSTNTRHKTKTKRLGYSALKGLKNHHFDGTTFDTYGTSYAWCKGAGKWRPHAAMKCRLITEHFQQSL